MYGNVCSETEVTTMTHFIYGRIKECQRTNPVPIGSTREIRGLHEFGELASFDEIKIYSLVLRI